MVVLWGIPDPLVASLLDRGVSHDDGRDSHSDPPRPEIERGRGSYILPSPIGLGFLLVHPRGFVVELPGVLHELRPPRVRVSHGPALRHDCV